MIYFQSWIISVALAICVILSDIKICFKPYLNSHDQNSWDLAPSIMVDPDSDSASLLADSLLYSTYQGLSPPWDAIAISRLFISAIISCIYKCYCRTENAIINWETPSISARIKPPAKACLKATDVPPLSANKPPVIAPEAIALNESSLCLY